MVDGFGIQGADHTNVVGDFADVWEKVADPGAVLPVLFEIDVRWRNREGSLPAGHPGQALALPDGLRELLAKHLAEFGLVIKGFQLGRCARLEEVDDAFGLGGKVRQARQHGCHVVFIAFPQIGNQQGAKGQ